LGLILPRTCLEFLLLLARTCKSRSMHTYHHAQVQPDDIDDLGHMNVRVYARHAAAAAHSLMADAGLDARELARTAARIQQPDCHTLFRHEQLLGSRLLVRGGVLDVAESCIHVYLELVNADSDEIAATFCKEIRLVGVANAGSRVIPQAVRERAASLVVDWPAHGRPRSLTLDPVRRELTVADMTSRGITPRFPGYRVTPEMSTPDGFMELSGAPWLAFADMPIQREQVSDDAEASWFADSNFSVATLESRHSLVGVPRSGEKIVTYTAITDVGRKIVRFCHWSFAERSEDLLAILQEIGIGLNLETRRACEFPASVRADLQARSHADLR
jgi:acyl-CoA thioesterase FadM